MYRDDIESESWLQEHLRMIVSGFIVLAFALGIYSYGNRTEMEKNPDKVISCEEYGNNLNIDYVPLRCKAYWSEKIK